MNITDIKKIIETDLKDCNKFIEKNSNFEEGEYLEDYIYEQGFKDGLKNVLIYLNKIK